MQNHSYLVSTTTSANSQEENYLFDLPREILQMIFDALPYLSDAYNFLWTHSSLWEKRDDYLKVAKILSAEERTQCLDKRKELHTYHSIEAKRANYIMSAVCTMKWLPYPALFNQIILHNAVAVGNLPLVKFLLEEGEFGKRDKVSNQLVIDLNLLKELGESALEAPDNEVMVLYLLALSKEVLENLLSSREERPTLSNFIEAKNFTKALKKGYKEVIKQLLDQWQLRLNHHMMIENRAFPDSRINFTVADLWKTLVQEYDILPIHQYKRLLPGCNEVSASTGILRFLLQHLKTAEEHLDGDTGNKVLNRAIAVADIDSIQLLTNYYKVTPNKYNFEAISQVGRSHHRYVPDLEVAESKRVLDYFLENYKPLIEENKLYRQYFMIAAARAGWVESIEPWLVTYPIEDANYYTPIIEAAAENGQLAIIQILCKNVKISNEILEALMITGVVENQWEVVKYLLEQVTSIAWDIPRLMRLAAKTGQLTILKGLLTEKTEAEITAFDIDGLFNEAMNWNQPTSWEFSSKEPYWAVGRQQIEVANYLVEKQAKLVPTKAMLEIVCQFPKRFKGKYFDDIKLLAAHVKFTFKLINQFRENQGEDAIVQQWIKNYIQQIANTGYLQPLFEIFVKNRDVHLSWEEIEAKDLIKTVLKNALKTDIISRGMREIQVGPFYKSLNKASTYDVCDMSYQLLTQYQLESEGIGASMLHAFAHEGRLELMMDLIKQRGENNVSRLIEDKKIVDQYFPQEKLGHSAKQFYQTFFPKDDAAPVESLSPSLAR